MTTAVDDSVLGMHHVTAVSAKIADNLAFYTGVMGMRLVKKSVNQDDVTAYHLFYADAVGSPGTDLTFFDWPRVGPNRPGRAMTQRTALRVAGPDALRFWEARLADAGIAVERGEDGGVRFADPEGMALELVDDTGLPGRCEPFSAVIPDDYAVRGILGVTLASARPDLTRAVLERLLGFATTDGVTYQVTSTDGMARVQLAEGGDAMGRVGAGGVHHVAFRVRDDDHLLAMQGRIEAAGLPTSGPVDRFYFHSLYFREPGGILFELATDGPGMHADESIGALGERLALPPFLANRRAQIEANLRPLPAPAYSELI